MKKTYQIVFIALMTAIICVFTQLAIPLPSGVPITLQTFAIPLAGYFLGIIYGPISVLAFLVLGSIGLPVFSGYQGGFQILIAGFTGGFLWGFIPFSILCGLSTLIKTENKILKQIISLSLGFAGLILCHLLGVIQYSSISGRSFIEAVLLVSLPYLLKDSILLVVSYYVSLTLKKTLKPLLQNKNI